MIFILHPFLLWYFCWSLAADWLICFYFNTFSGILHGSSSTLCVYLHRRGPPDVGQTHVESFQLVSFSASFALFKLPAFQNCFQYIWRITGWKVFNLRHLIKLCINLYFCLISKFEMSSFTTRENLNMKWWTFLVWMLSLNVFLFMKWRF